MKLPKAIIESILKDYPFTYEELWGITTKGSPTKLEYEALITFLEFRSWHNYKTLLLSAYRDDQGTHGKGLAFDVVLYKEWKKTQPTFMEMWERAVRFRKFEQYDNNIQKLCWNGVGIYTDTKVDNKPTLMLHLDVSTASNRPAYWIRQDGTYYYWIGDRQFQSKFGDKITLESAEKHFNY
jgi:hypothetical protein